MNITAAHIAIIMPFSLALTSLSKKSNIPIAKLNTPTGGGRKARIYPITVKAPR